MSTGSLPLTAGVLYLILDLIPHKLAIIGSGLWLNYQWYMIDAPLRDDLYLPISRLLLHDLSKFKMDEFIPYSNHFRGANKTDNSVTKRFRNAVQRHFSRNTHHAEYYKHNGFRMPLIDLLELLCDSFAANWSYTRKWPKQGEWRYIENKWGKMKLHEANKIVLGALLNHLGYGHECGGIDGDTEKAKRLLSEQEYRIYLYFLNEERQSF